MGLKTKIQQLIRIVEESNIEELEVSSFWGAQKIRVSKGKSSNVQHVVLPTSEPIAQQQAHPASKTVTPEPSTEQSIDKSLPPPEAEPIQPEVSANLLEQKAPLVGTFYKSSKPGAPAFVNEGDSVTKGQIICIIEAMKIFNEIEADHSGKIIEILIDDATPVEYDQPLMLIDPA